MSVSSTSKEARKQRLQTQNQIITSVGCLFVAAVGAFSTIGTQMAINNINRDAQDMIVYAKQQMQNQVANTDVVVEEKTNTDKNVTDDVSADKPVTESTKWSDEQIRWMEENQIRYNEDGKPVDIHGNVVVDPTVQKENDDSTPDDESVSNITLEEEITDVDDSETVSIENPETDTNWASDKDWLTQNEDGDYEYKVKRVDTLSCICEKAGFDMDEIVEYNQISNPNLIRVGQIIRFPQAGPSGTAHNTNLGLG